MVPDRIDKPVLHNVFSCCNQCFQTGQGAVTDVCCLCAFTLHTNCGKIMINGVFDRHRGLQQGTEQVIKNNFFLDVRIDHIVYITPWDHTFMSGNIV